MQITGENLSIFAVHHIAVDGEPVTVGQDQLAAVQHSYESLRTWGEASYPMYGVTTGFGELIHITIPPQHKSTLQANLIRSHAAGAGNEFPVEVVRAIMVARLNCLLKGYAGVRPQLIHFLQHLLNHQITPLIFEQGSLGASGDLVPLAQMALVCLGEGSVRKNGQLRPAREVLLEEGLEPLELEFKEGLALINGTSAMTGVACIALVRAYHLLQVALLASAEAIQCLRGSTRPFDARGHLLKNHSGQIKIAQVLRTLLQESKLTHEHQDLVDRMIRQANQGDQVTDTHIHLQDAYSLRCVPQILGPVLETLGHVRMVIEEELNSCNDNPLIFETPEETFHGGNFHGQYVAQYCDFLNVAVAEIGVLAERQLNRLLDPHLNKPLPPFLAYQQAGLFCGFEGAQYLATSIASENLDLAAPSSIKTLPSNGANQDVVSMGLNAARKSLTLCKNVATILSVLVAACHQASSFLGADRLSPATQQFHYSLSHINPIYQDHIPASDYLQRVRSWMVDAQVISALHTWIPLVEGIVSQTDVLVSTDPSLRFV